MNQRIDELNKVADKIEQHVNSAVDRWRNLSEQTRLRFGFKEAQPALTKEIILGIG